MSDYSGSVSFEFNIEDNVTATTDKMAASQEVLASKAKTTIQSFESQRLKNLEAFASLNALRGGLREATASMHELGMVNDSTYEAMRKVVSGITLVSSTAETLKGAIGTYNMLVAASRSYAVASVFAAVASNPLIGIAAIGAAAGAAGLLLTSMNSATSSSSSSSTVNNTTNVNFQSAPTKQERMVSSGLNTGSYY